MTMAQCFKSVHKNIALAKKKVDVFPLQPTTVLYSNFYDLIERKSYSAPVLQITFKDRSVCKISNPESITVPSVIYLD